MTKHVHVTSDILRSVPFDQFPIASEIAGFPTLCLFYLVQTTLWHHI